MRKHAIGMVVKNRWNCTHKTLQSLYHTDQDPATYDLFIIDNGSDEDQVCNLRTWAEAPFVPLKNIILTKGYSLPRIWNLFLAITQDYVYRTKLDNDLVFANTPISKAPFVANERRPNQATPGESGSNPGAIPVAGFVTGAGAKFRQKKARTHTCFLDHIEDAIHTNHLGIASLAPVSEGQNLNAVMPTLGTLRWRTRNYLVGACMTISKDVFNRIGYFDERLPCCIDRDYSQRAMAEKINVGYASDYCVIHFGEQTPTLTESERQQQHLYAQSVPMEQTRKESKWSEAADKILKAAQKHMVLNLI